MVAAVCVESCCQRDERQQRDRLDDLRERDRGEHVAVDDDDSVHRVCRADDDVSHDSHRNTVADDGDDERIGERNGRFIDDDSANDNNRDDYRDDNDSNANDGNANDPDDQEYRDDCVEFHHLGADDDSDPGDG